MSIKADLAILGAGPGGYVAAIRAAQLGAEVVVVEEGKVGGVCLNVGCIPTKALLRSAEVYRTFLEAGSFGLKVDGTVSPDWAAIQSRKASVVDRLVGGVGFLLRKAGVQVVQGRGSFVGSRILEVTTAEGKERIEAKNIVIATGSRPIVLPLPGKDLPGVIDSTGALDLASLPDRLIVIGGGVIGVEFADIFGAFGVQVTIVEMLDRLLPLMDADLGATLARVLKGRKVKLHLGSKVTSISKTESGLQAQVSKAKGDLTVDTDMVLVAVGRQPNIEDLGLEFAGVKADRTGIAVNAQMQTNVPGVYAIGDVVAGGMQLAHVASMGGEVAVEVAMGREGALDLKSTPSAVYTDPEVASVGLSEAGARKAGYDVQVGTFGLRANGKALTYGHMQGFVKMVTEAQYGEVLGLHIVAPHASDLIHEGALALSMEATVDQILATIHGHPTLGEAVREATMETRGEAIHLPH